MVKKPVTFFLWATFGLALLLAAVLWVYGAPLDGLQSWLIAVSAIAFLTCGYDKAVAGRHRTRIPEKVLLSLALAGGTAGTLLGMGLFRHKTVKGSFLIKFWLVVAVQIGLVAAYYFLIKPSIAA